VANNYLAHARCLAESFRAFHPDGRMFVLLVDTPPEALDLAAEPFVVVPVASLAMPQFQVMAFRYTLLEFCTAVKPFFLAYLLAQYQLDHIIFLDPDVYLYGPLTPLLQALAQYDVILTPHLLAPLTQPGHPSELEILQAGAYNLGCIALRHSPQMGDLLGWWQQRLEALCYNDVRRGLMVD
jgi:hypothetical protein